MDTSGIGLPFGAKEQFHVGGGVFARDDESAHRIHQAAFEAVGGVAGDVEAETVG